MQPYRDGAMFRKCDGSWFVMMCPRESLFIGWGVFLELNESGQVLRYEEGAVKELFFTQRNSAKGTDKGGTDKGGTG